MKKSLLFVLIILNVGVLFSQSIEDTVAWMNSILREKVDDTGIEKITPYQSIIKDGNHLILTTRKGGKTINAVSLMIIDETSIDYDKELNVVKVYTTDKLNNIYVKLHTPSGKKRSDSKVNVLEFKMPFPEYGPRFVKALKHLVISVKKHKRNYVF